MKLLAGVDIGNATTEAAIALKKDDAGLEFLASGLVKTTGLKGTEQNINGVFTSIKQALDQCGIPFERLDLIRINEAAPVIGDVAMDTITETVITESTMIGHNPSSPGGLGLGAGFTASIMEIKNFSRDISYILVIPEAFDFSYAAGQINQAVENGITISGAILQKDDGVLLSNRLRKKIPIVDEVTLIEKIPLGMKAAIEVASPGNVIEHLSNPYGIAAVFDLDPDETKLIVPIARALIGNRSAVVIKTPAGDVQERVIRAGEITLAGEKKTRKVNVDEGAEAIMQALEASMPLADVQGEPGTNAGGMFERIRQMLSQLTAKHPKEIKIRDILAVDTFAPQKVTGGLAGEFAMENAVGIAAMVKADKLQMQKIAGRLRRELNVTVEVGGVEADMAVRGALTTPGTKKPLAILDMGAGSTDASYISRTGEIKSIHLAGAGNMVTLLINTELGLNDTDLAEDIKKYPLAKVESLFHIRHEDGSVQFFEKPLEPKLFARVIFLREGKMFPIPGNLPIEKIISARREAKQKVFVTNTLRALRTVSPTHEIRDIEYVVMVGGSALDFEIPQMITGALANYGIVAGRGNIRSCEGPRNAVATGLVLGYGEEIMHYD